MLELRIVFENFALSHPGSQPIEHIPHGDPKAPDTRLPGSLPRLDGDARAHDSKLTLLTPDSISLPDMRFSPLALVLVAAALQAQPAKSAPSCDRACLEGFVNQYLDAMVARNPYALPLAPKVKFTENEQVIPLGEGIWGTASGLGTYKLYVADPQAGQVGFLGTLRENDTPVAIALRLKIEHRLIREVETIVVRDPGAAKAVEALGQPDPLMLAPLPASERRSRDEMIAIANKYSEGIEHSNGKLVPFDPACNRSRTASRPPTIPR